MSRAERAAQQVLSAYWPGTFPVDPQGLAQAMGVEVFAESLIFDIGAPLKLADGSSGLYEQADGHAPRIYYNSDEAAVRQRFTLAHELGHHVLGHGTAFRDNPQTFNVYNRAPQEVEANAFAAALLMPHRYVWADFMAGRASDIASVAKRYGVSQMAMVYRLRNLGIARI